MEPQSAADLIRDEHPQIIATILVHLKRAQAADILALFDERLRHDVMLRIATFWWRAASRAGGTDRSTEWLARRSESQAQ